MRDFVDQSGILRPPWSTEASVRRNCTSCGDCIRACPEGILRPGRAGTPVVDFDQGACTFCRACADACGEAVFDLDTAPWRIVASPDAACLLRDGIACRICTDACDTAALRFDPRAGRVGEVIVDPGACTGCGACAGTCPVGAIAFSEPHPHSETVT